MRELKLGEDVGSNGERPQPAVRRFLWRTQAAGVLPGAGDDIEWLRLRNLGKGGGRGEEDLSGWSPSSGDGRTQITLKMVGGELGAGRFNYE